MDISRGHTAKAKSLFSDFPRLAVWPRACGLWDHSSGTRGGEELRGEVLHLRGRLLFGVGGGEAPAAISVAPSTSRVRTPTSD